MNPRTIRKLVPRSFSLHTALLGAAALASPFQTADAREAIVFAHKAFDAYWTTTIHTNPNVTLDNEEAYYLPDPDRTYNGFNDDQIKIVQGAEGSGNYYVSLYGVSVNDDVEHVIVQAAGHDNAHCNSPLRTWGHFIHVRCSKPTAFILRVVDYPDRDSDEQALYVTGNRAGSDFEAIRDHGAEYDVTRLSNGVLRFNTPGLDNRGTAHVTARDNNSRCTVRNRGTGVDVACFRKWWPEDDWQLDPSVAFTLIYEEHEHAGNAASNLGGGETRLTENPSWYPMRNYHFFNGVQVPYSLYLESSGWAPGVYGVRYSGIASHVFSSNSVPFVTASYEFTPSNHYCKPVSLWGDSQDTSTGYLLVRCFDQNGNPTKGHFIQNVLWWLVLDWS